MKITVDSNGKPSTYSGMKTARVCDMCKAPLTTTLPGMKGKFGTAQRVIEGVVTLSWSRKLQTETGAMGKADGEWCGKCAPEAIRVFCDSLLDRC